MPVAGWLQAGHSQLLASLVRTVGMVRMVRTVRLVGMVRTVRVVGMVTQCRWGW